MFFLLLCLWPDEDKIKEADNPGEYRYIGNDFEANPSQIADAEGNLRFARNLRESKVMKFKIWMEQKEKKTFDIEIEDLILTKDEIEAAVSNLSRGMSSMTSGPLFVSKHPLEGKYELTNGYHRLVEALMRGKTSVTVMNQGDAEWKMPSNDRLFKPDFDKEYYGMEDFTEYYELKNL